MYCRHRYAVLSFLALTTALFAQNVTTVRPHGATSNTPTATLTTVPRAMRVTTSFQPADGSSAAPVEGATVAIYRDEIGGSPLWQETVNFKLGSDGKYSALVGAQSADGIPLDLFTTDEPRWLGIQFNRAGEVEQARLRLASVPYALKAADAETLGGHPASDYVLSPTPAGTSATTALVATPNFTGPLPKGVSGTQGYIAYFTDASDIQNSNIFQLNTGGVPNIGINTTTPTNLLTVADATSGAPIQISVINSNSAGRANYNVTNDQGYYVGVQMAGSNFTSQSSLHNLASIFSQGVGVSAFFIASNGERATGGSTPIELVAGGYNNTPAVYIAPGNPGKVGIGTMTPAYNLDVAGDVNLSGTLHFGTGPVRIAGIRGVTTGSNDALPVVIDSTGQLGTVSSSRRFKEDIQDMGQASAGLMRLRPVTFRYKKPFTDGSKPIQYGLIAEEVEEVYPDLVAHSADGQIQSVKYQVLDSMLLNEVQKQQHEIDAQRQTIDEQQKQIEALNAKLSALSSLEARLTALENAASGNR